MKEWVSNLTEISGTALKYSKVVIGDKIGAKVSLKKGQFWKKFNSIDISHFLIRLKEMIDQCQIRIFWKTQGFWSTTGKTKWSLSAIVPQESTANSNLGCGTIITSGTIAEIRDFWLRYYYYQRYFYLRLESTIFSNAHCASS